MEDLSSYVGKVLTYIVLEEISSKASASGFRADVCARDMEVNDPDPEVIIVFVDNIDDMIITKFYIPS